LISLVETGGEAERAVASMAFPHTGRAWVIGVTGAPGVGKSTLVDGLVGCLRENRERVAVVAVDPSSPVSGGAFLGDRVRLQRHATDPDVFVRSMGSRGQPGGLARATRGAVRVLDAAGWPWVIVETAGAGQVEADVAEAVDTTLVVVTPGWGDSIQAAKAGLLEVADAFVLNKADLPGADEVARHLESTIGLPPADETHWRPPIVRTVASSGAGAAAVWAAVERHRAYLSEGRRLAERRGRRLAAEVRALVLAAITARAQDLCRGPAFDAMVSQVTERAVDPVSAADALLAGYSGNTPSARSQTVQ
jgi:LAO/AO transport system kinase